MFKLWILSSVQGHVEDSQAFSVESFRLGVSDRFCTVDRFYIDSFVAEWSFGGCGGVTTKIKVNPVCALHTVIGQL